MFKNIYFYHILQYQVDPSDQTYENDQKPNFWLFGSVINEFLWFLNYHSWYVKHMKMAKNLIFGSSDHSKMHFYGFWMILYDMAVLPNVGEHLVLSKFAISSRLDGPKSRKWPKTSFLAIWIIQKWFFMVFEWSGMCDMVTKLLRTFSIIKICNMKSIGATQLEKLTADWMDHSKILPLLQKKTLKIGKIFPGHAVFAVISGKVSIFILNLQIYLIND